LLKNIYIIGLLIAFATPVFSQFSTCDTNLIYAHLNPAGFQRLYVPNQACSMYFYNPTPMYGIDAHRDAANLGIPQMVIDNAQENTDLLNALNAQGVFPTNFQVWMGITDSATTYTFRTFSGALAPAYTNWAAGEPNNRAPSCQFLGSCFACTGADAYACAHGEDCAVMSNSNGVWLDITCEGSGVTRIAVLELNTCPVITRPRDTSICSGNPVNVTTTAISGGTAPYTYTWNPGGLSGQTVTVTPATTSTYTVEASDSYHCKTDSTFTVTVSSSTPPSINISQATICSGVNNTISLSTVSATASYTWNFGASAVTVSGSGSGPYVVNWTSGGTKTINVTVTDNGCTAQATATVTVDTASAVFTINPASVCTGQNTTVTIAHPSGTATYSWSFSGANIVSGSGSGPYTVNWPSPGPETISVTVTDNSCTATNASNVNVSNGLTPSFTFNPATNVCPGQAVSVTLTGAVSPTATYTWNFNGGTVLSGSGGGPYSVSWATSGTQTVDLTVTDGCTGSASGSITITGSITADAGPDITLCPGSAGQLGAASTAGYIYSWSPATGLSSAGISDPTITIPSNPTGNTIIAQYVLTVSSGSCIAKDTVNVTIYPDINNNFSINPATICVGNDATVTYSGTPSGTATYNWIFGSANVVSGSGAGPYSINYAATGSQSISLSVTDNGCTAAQVTNTVSVGTPVTAVAGNSQTVCSGTSVQLGVAPASGVNYSWTPSTNLNNAAIANPVFQQTNTGTTPIVNALMLVADAGGCPDTAYVTITVNPAGGITITAAGPTSFCQGDSVTLSAAGPSLISYHWSDGDTLPTTTVKQAGTYTVTATDVNGCQQVSSPAVTVTISTAPTVSLAVNGEIDESCPNAKDGSLTVQATGGTPAYNYIWNTSPAQNGPTATGLAPGSYTVSVSDASGCTATGSYNINAATYLGIVIDSTRNVSCYGKADGAVYAEGIGGAAPYSFLWSNGSITGAATGLKADSVSVVLTDNNGCKVDTTVSVTQPPKITISYIGTLEIVYGKSQLLAVTVTPGSLSYIYSWSPASSLSCSDCQSPVASPVQTTAYTLTVTDPASGCYDTITLDLIVHPVNNLYVPNAFTPNGNGTNDVLYVYTTGGIKFFEIMIWDRWGELVYRSNDIGEGWDGTYQGTKVTDGNYVYHVNATFLDGETINNKGTIALIR
jgi:gliding motility-associated-like protein